MGSVGLAERGGRAGRRLRESTFLSYDVYRTRVGKLVGIQSLIYSLLTLSAALLVTYKLQLTVTPAKVISASALPIKVVIS